jgi:hypothetical protein
VRSAALGTGTLGTRKSGLAAETTEEPTMGFSDGEIIAGAPGVVAVTSAEVSDEKMAKIATGGTVGIATEASEADTAARGSTATGADVATGGPTATEADVATEGSTATEADVATDGFTTPKADVASEGSTAPEADVATREFTASEADIATDDSTVKEVSVFRETVGATGAFAENMAKILGRL